MTGRRLVDLFALVNVSSSIARGHFLLRSQQLNIYATSSSVLKGFRPRPQIVPSRTSQASVRPYDASAVPLKEEGVKQDHSCVPGASATLDPEPRSDSHITQKKVDRYPLPDGKISPSNSPRADKLGSESSSWPTRSRPPPEEAKRLQNASESSIPEMTADPPGGDVALNTGTDVFYLRQARVSSVLSNLPRKKIPRLTEGEQVPTSARRINADVFYETPGQVRDARKLPEKMAIPEQGGMGSIDGVSHSKRPGELKPKAANALGDTAGLTKGKDQTTSYVRTDGDEVPSDSNAKASELRRDSGEHTGIIVEQASLSEMCALSLLPPHLLFYLIR